MRSRRAARSGPRRGSPAGTARCADPSPRAPCGPSCPSRRPPDRPSRRPTEGRTTAGGRAPRAGCAADGVFQRPWRKTSPYARTAATRSLARTGGGALAQPERRTRLRQRQLPDGVRPRLTEAEVGVDGEHVLVHVRVAGADELRVRALAQDALEHDRLHPEAELVAAVRLDDAGTALPDDMTDARVVLHLGEAGALAGRLMDRDDEPPLGPRLFQPRLAIAQLCLGEALICEAQIALGHVVHRIRRVEVRLHELARNDVVGAREAVTLRFDLRPLRDLRAVDLGEDELVQLHRKARRRRDRLRERRTRRHAGRRLPEEHQVVALSDAGLDERAHDRATDALAAMRGEDVHLGPARVRVLGLVLVPADEAGADERSRHIARG